MHKCMNVQVQDQWILMNPSSLAMHHKVPFDALNSFSYPTNYSNTEIKNYSNTEINESHPGLAASSLTVQWMFMHLHCIHANIWHIGLIFLNTYQNLSLLDLPWQAFTPHGNVIVRIQRLPFVLIEMENLIDSEVVRILIVLPSSIRIQTTSIWLNLAASSIGRPPLS